ncbi:MAG: SIS domain-containing protein [Actinobacteria bacterium]|nr:SIS domain-containing protein [Actinomycetota bacterium]
MHAPAIQYDSDHAASSAGWLFLREIRDQPAALERLLEQAAEIATLGEALAARRPRLVRLVAHGSSDNAAAYGVYAFGLLAGWTAVRDSISLPVYYGASVRFDDSTVLALSQSGSTPDVVAYVEHARARGAFTVAVTNEPASPLAEAAHAVLFLAAGEERAIAATKTYTNQLAALALLAAAVGGRGGSLARDIARLADQLARALDPLEAAVLPIADALVDAVRMFVVGRGAEFASARETALKLVETCRVAAVPLTATDLVHGPVAALEPLFPVWAIASDDATLPAVATAVRRARETGAPVIACGSAAGALDGASHRLPTPVAPIPVLAPLLTAAPGQLFAWALARAKGLDPDRPSHLTKVTLTP